MTTDEKIQDEELQYVINSAAAKIYGSSPGKLYKSEY